MCPAPVTGNNFLISDGDNIYKSTVFDKLTSDLDDGIYITIDHKEHYDDDDTKVILTDNRVSQVSKKIHTVDANAESVVFARVSGQQTRQLFQQHLLDPIKE